MLGQVSIEFIVLLSILIVILTFTVYYNSSFYIQANSARNYNDAQEISDQASSEINLALKIGDGYSRMFYIPNKISNSIENFTISVSNYAVVLEWPGGFVTSPILTKNITGNLEKGQNIIRNLDGVIYVSQ